MLWRITINPRTIYKRVSKKIDKMLSFGSVGLGIDRVEEDNTAKTRLEKDLSKERT